MGQVLVVKNKGLNTAPNELSGVPEGSLNIADNCSIDQDNLLEPRRGFSRLLQFSDIEDRARSYAVYQEKLICAYSNGKMAWQNGGAWNDYAGTYNDPNATDAKLRFALAGSQLYFTTNLGVYRLGAYNGTPRLAGAPKGLDVELQTSGAGGFFIANNQVAYRMVWGYKESDGTIILGAPSGRSTLINSTPASSYDVSVTFTIPSEVTTSFFYQIYRSPLSNDSTVEPSDEMGLVYEAYPTQAEIAAKTITITDSTPDSLRGVTLYTSPSQEGILQANSQPPKAKDIAVYENCLFYANCTSKQRLSITLVSASSLQVGNIVTIANVQYTAGNTENIATRTFKIFSSGTPAQNIADTTNSLIRVINRATENTFVYATLLSGANDLPGQVLLEERTLGGDAFSATMSANGIAFSPSLPVSGSSVSSSSDDFKNQVYFSKTDKFDSVPLTNYLFVGSKNNKILRIFPLKSSLFVFKENEGIYRITGNVPGNFGVELFDSSASLLAANSIAVVNNQLWALSDQGIITLSETGVQVVSRPIEDMFLKLYGISLEALKQKSFGVGYETDRRYILFTVTNSLDNYCTQAFAWNTFTRTFTRWDKTATAGIANPNDKRLYLGEGSTNYTLQERKSFTYLDYVDHSIDATITAVNGKSVTLSDVSEISVGDVLYQGGASSSIQDITNNVVTLNDTISSLVVGAANVFIAYKTVVEYTPITAGNPGALKQWPEIAMLFRGSRFNKAKIGFATDISGSFDEFDFVGSRNGLWGLFKWSKSHWGIPAPSTPVRVYVPTEKQYGSYLRVRFTVREGFCPWKLNGLSIPFRETGSQFIAK